MNYCDCYRKLPEPYIEDIIDHPISTIDSKIELPRGEDLKELKDKVICNYSEIIN